MELLTNSLQPRQCQGSTELLDVQNDCLGSKPNAEVIPVMDEFNMKSILHDAHIDMAEFQYLVDTRDDEHFIRLQEITAELFKKG